jgi:tRNA modification GTPase
MDKKASGFRLQVSGFQPLETSLIAGAGISELKASISKKLGGISNAPAHAVISERHRDLLETARVELEQARERLADGGELGAAPAAEHLRAALEALGQVTGRVYHNELLDNIFSRFCIGK